MKKVYSAPELSVVAVETISMFAASPTELGRTTKNNNGSVSGGLAKDRDYDEDEEVYNAMSGEGMSSYGDLW